MVRVFQVQWRHNETAGWIVEPKRNCTRTFFSERTGFSFPGRFTLMLSSSMYTSILNFIVMGVISSMLRILVSSFVYFLAPHRLFDSLVCRNLRNTSANTVQSLFSHQRKTKTCLPNESQPQPLSTLFINNTSATLQRDSALTLSYFTTTSRMAKLIPTTSSNSKAFSLYLRTMPMLWRHAIWHNVTNAANVNNVNIPSHTFPSALYRITTLPPRARHLASLLISSLPSCRSNR